MAISQVPDWIFTLNTSPSLLREAGNKKLTHYTFSSLVTFLTSFYRDIMVHNLAAKEGVELNYEEDNDLEEESDLGK